MLNLFRLQVQDRINSHNGLRVIDEAAEHRYLEGEDIPGAAIDDPLAKVYPLVWICPVTNRQALMPHPPCMHALEQASESGSRFLGVIESRQKVEKLTRPAIAPEPVYVHPWQPGDLVIWDNRSTWYSATGKLSRDDRRVMHFNTFNSDDPPRCDLQIGGI